MKLSVRSVSGLRLGDASGKMLGAADPAERASILCGRKEVAWSSRHDRRGVREKKGGQFLQQRGTAVGVGELGDLVEAV